MLHRQNSVLRKYQFLCIFIVVCLLSTWIEAAHGLINVFVESVVPIVSRYITSSVNTIHDFQI